MRICFHPTSFTRQLAVVAALSLSAAAWAGQTVAPVFSTAEGAIRGYDPVAYFTEKKAHKGKPEFSYAWQGAEWHFASQKNLDAFKADPEKYAPQYGGYCAYGVAQGYTPEIDPQAFKVVDGKLYLNLSRDVLKRWQKDIPGYVRDANKNWPELKAGTYVEK